MLKILNYDRTDALVARPVIRDNKSSTAPQDAKINENSWRSRRKKREADALAKEAPLVLPPHSINSFWYREREGQLTTRSARLKMSTLKQVFEEKTIAVFAFAIAKNGVMHYY